LPCVYRQLVSSVYFTRTAAAPADGEAIAGNK
jgi:hypothetical protein